MVEVKQKEQVGRRAREVRSTCKAGGVVCEISTGEGHTIRTDEPEERGGTNTGAAPL